MLVLFCLFVELIFAVLGQDDHFDHAHFLLHSGLKAIDFPSSVNGNVLDSSTFVKEILQIVRKNFPSLIPFWNDIQVLIFVSVVVLVGFLLFLNRLFSHPFKQ